MAKVDSSSFLSSSGPMFPAHVARTFAFAELSLNLISHSLQTHALSPPTTTTTLYNTSKMLKKYVLSPSRDIWRHWRWN